MTEFGRSGHEKQKQIYVHHPKLNYMGAPFNSVTPLMHPNE